MTATHKPHDERPYGTVIEALPRPVMVVSPEGEITDTNAELCNLIRCERAGLVGRSVYDAVAFTDAAGRRLETALRPTATALARGEEVDVGTGFDLFLRRADGQLVPVVAHTAPVREGPRGEIVALVTALDDIGVLDAAGATQLPNPSLFADRVVRAIAALRSTGRVVAVLAIVPDVLDDIDDFHEADAQRLVADVAAEIGRVVTEPAVGGGVASAAHLGDAVFGALLPDLDTDLDAVRRAQHLADLLARRRVGRGRGDHPLSATIGVALGDAATDDRVGVVRAAVAAARRPGRPSPGPAIMLADSIGPGTVASLRRQIELREAIDHDQLVVHFQPEIDLRTGRAVAVEALVRWDHPTQGLLGPEAFLPLAHEAGLIVPLGWRVLEQACRQVARWRAQAEGHGRGMTLSVNLDAAQLADPHVAGRVQQVVDDAGLDPSALVLEITEHGVMGDADLAADRLRQLKRLGIRIAIDDFGTGYSSLVQLRRFPVDYLKIDRSFVAGMTRESEDAAIVAATVRLARSLGLETIAEGVETQEQLVRLRVLGCDFAQGFHWSRALPADELADWWAAHQLGPRGLLGPADRTDEDAFAALDEVVAYLSHELRSPLAVITGYAGLALDHADDEITRLLEPILRHAEDLDRRISMLAEIRAVSEGAIRLDAERVELCDIVETLVDDLSPQLAPHRVALRSDAPVLVAVDVSRILQAVSNLLFNAAKFSPPDTAIDVFVRARGGAAEVMVRDRGPGIPEERRPELFRRFARLGSARRGMGVGLYLVRAIARAHGGDARYEPAPGGGSCFVIAVPLLDQATAGSGER